MHQGIDNEVLEGTSLRRRERGFTLIEVIVVTIVLLVIMAIAVPTFTKTRSDATRDGFVDAARGYATAIEAYRMDNAGKVPTFGDVNQWPNGTSALAKAGPVNRLIDANDPALRRKRLYMSNGVPDAMVSQGGEISGTAAAPKTNHIQYIKVSAMEYSLLVSFKDGEVADSCYVGADPQPGDTNDSRPPFSCDK